MVISIFVLKYIFVKLQDLEKETEFRFLLGQPTNTPTAAKSTTKEELRRRLLWTEVVLDKRKNMDVPIVIYPHDDSRKSGQITRRFLSG